ncbi:MAG: septation protein A [Alphaproteobacteria bacterium]|nr:septation protein A [Alphaproteobacteria bacterium]
MKPWLKPALDFGPLLAFFIAYKFAGLMPATAVLIALTAVSLAATYALERKIHAAPLLSALLVSAFGGLTLWLNDEHFIKLKPTLINLLFAVVLLGGACFGKGLLKPLLGMALVMPDAAWRILSVRWGVFFLALAGINELVWRNTSTDLWVNFKVFGILPLIVLFSLTQLKFIQHHVVEADKTPH